MKRMLKLVILNMIFVFAMGTYQLAYEGDRLVDIPVPPNSSGYADFTSEEGEQQAKEYEQNKVGNQEKNISENYIEKEDKQSKTINRNLVIIVVIIIIVGAGVGINKIYHKKSKKS